MISTSKKKKEKLPVKAVVIRKYVGTESMESVFKEIMTDEVEDALKSGNQIQNELDQHEAD